MKACDLKIVSLGLACQLLAPGAQADSKGPPFVWQNRDPAATFGQATSVDASREVAVAVGQVSATYALSARDWFVRAYDTSSGATLWQDRIDAAGLRDEAAAVAVHDGRAFVVGDLQTSTTCASNFVIRAYGLRTGALLWERRYECGSAASVVAIDGQVFAVGSRLDAATNSDVGAVVALDAQTGTTLWESKTAGTGGFATAAAVQAEENRLYVAGQKLVSSDTKVFYSMYVQAYDRHRGALLWEHVIPHASTGPTDAVPLVVSRKGVAVGGASDTGSPDFPWDYRVTMLDRDTGALRWTDQVHRQAGGLSAGLGFGAGKLIAYGWDCEANVSNCHGDLRAYDPDSGSLQWENRFTGPGGDIVIPIPGPAAFAVRGDQVYLGTALLDKQGDEYRWTVRTYDGNRGMLRAQSQTYDGGGIGDGVEALKLLDDRLYAVGYVDSASGFDFAIRTYATDCDGQ